MAAIQHVFVLMLENRSYDSVFGWSNLTGTTPAGAPTAANGLPTTPIVNFGRTGTSYQLGKGSPYALGFDPGHEFTDVCVQLCGLQVASGDTVRNDALVLGTNGYPPFATDASTTGFAATYEDHSDTVADAFSAFTPDQLPVLNFLARQFGVCDSWFASIPGPTWPNRFFAVAGTSSGLDHSPSDAQVVEAVFFNAPLFTFPNGTVFSKLQESDWLIVQGDVAQARGIHGMQNLLNRFVSMDTLISRLVGNSLTEKFIFIEPTYDAKNDFRNGNSMHPCGDVRRGEALVKQVYDAISTSSLWNNSVLLIVFDEHGGFFDHVTPPKAEPPGSAENARLKTHNFAFDRLGVRVPAIVVSPFVPAGTIDHSLYDHTSILKTTDALLGLNGALDLTARVHAADDFSKMLSLSTPRSVVPQCPSPVAASGDPRPSSEGSPRAKDPFLPLYAHH
ncbi:alkaline phosphatase family protein [Paraburkholderia terrae]|uniref:alkaline phosphatase family protein n=1 Tax=Paraburkholderia terrae TaxID=311230 RepID=UPI00296AAB7F|nr:alkaline phosphatase family protein [Paraburkholderia terrae]MDW3662798.1 alkaline phosphatase family protein [Paraburkholderia terrae]